MIHKKKIMNQFKKLSEPKFLDGSVEIIREKYLLQTSTTTASSFLL